MAQAGSLEFLVKDAGTRQALREIWQVVGAAAGNTVVSADSVFSSVVNANYKRATKTWVKTTPGKASWAIESNAASDHLRVVRSGPGTANTITWVDLAKFLSTSLTLSANLLFSGDNTKDIGAAGATRPKTGYFGTSLVVPTIGPAAAQQHTLPAVASDTVALLAAVQTFTNKTLTNPTINAGTLSGIFAGAHTYSGVVTFTEATSPIVSARLGPATTQQHVLPAVASDTLALLAAVQTLSSKTLASPIVTGQISAALGSAAAPTYVFTGNLGLGAFAISPDILGLATAGVERVRVDAAGLVGIGGGAVTGQLEVVGSNIINRGSSSGFKFNDRLGVASADWQWFASGGLARLFDHAASVEAIQVDSASFALRSALAARMIAQNRFRYLNAMVRVFRNTSQSIPNAAFTTIEWNNELLDTDNLHDNVTNNSRLTAAVSGKYLVAGRIAYAGNSTGVLRAARLIKNSTTVYDRTDVMSTTTAMAEVGIHVYAIVDLLAGDFVTIDTYQDSGEALGTSSLEQYMNFQMFYIGE